MKKLYFFLLLFPLFVLAQAPSGYYNAAVGKLDAVLKTSLLGIVGPHTERTYADLWTDFQSTDTRADGKVWDMYSTCTYTFVVNQDKGSGGTAECQFYNREHSFPASWFASATPMYSDLFHLYPADKYVNAERGNFPYGETTTPTRTYSNGSKKGNSTFEGYTGTVFEITDEFKGDFARTYFYMVTAYENKIAKDKWASDQLETDSIKKIYPSLSTWSINLLLKWHRQDPVSAKETNRNNAVYSIQNNRNPYIDYPMLAEHIWGTQKGIPWTITSGINELKVDFSISPNPVQDVLNIKTEEQDLNCIIYNTSGQQLLNKSLQGSGVIHVDHLVNGMYFIKVQSGTKSNVSKFIVNK
ncbi:MAG: endonuclease [Paludibacter sp.]|nr:endonuclease [Paludibacter sp.]